MDEETKDAAKCFLEFFFMLAIISGGKVQNGQTVDTKGFPQDVEAEAGKYASRFIKRHEKTLAEIASKQK